MTHKQPQVLPHHMTHEQAQALPHHMTHEQPQALPPLYEEDTVHHYHQETAST